MLFYFTADYQGGAYYTCVNMNEDYQLSSLLVPIALPLSQEEQEQEPQKEVNYRYGILYINLTQ